MNLGPTSAAERVEELDVLRGVALFGVFLINMIGFGGPDVIATEEQLLSLPTGALDFTALEIAEWLVADKANTLFAFLFGLGFYLQMGRAAARGADFERLYRRRLTILLVLGLIHLVLVWAWDILHLYALAGFALFGLRAVGGRTLLVGGVLLAFFGRAAQKLIELAVGADWHGLPEPSSAEAVLARQEAALAGNYWGAVRTFAEYTLVDYVLSGVIVGWFLYVLGRFMLGAWVGRQGWLQRAERYLPGFRRVLRLTLPGGLIGEGVARIVALYGDTGRLPEWPHWESLASGLHLLSVPVLATGYVCAIVVGFHAPLGRRLLAPFAPVGRMALTSYVAQSLVCGFVLFGVGPGLALAGRIGTVALIAIVIGAFAGQVLLSRWWLAHFRFGPLEWLWRALTYGERPSIRRQRAA